ncbi:MAG: 1-acyl-sn-glycerol-3-phosphate acyltransferase [Woeseiaceae bacterium]|nr:1-acyl-sn-glycerol-3-phosphate acyltransferase [Woeseiaceae bacterium]
MVHYRRRKFDVGTEVSLINEKVPAGVRATGSLPQRLARTLLRIGGWTLAGEVPDLPKAVFIAAPHTSNWDGIWLLAYKLAVRVQVKFFAKHTLFWWPLGPLLRRMGAIPVERTRSGAHVDRAVAMFADADHLFLALAPEGTRKWTPHWRTGFFRIARAADVPVVMAFIDYRRRRLGIGPVLDMNRDTASILATIREFYEDCGPAIPANMGPVRFPPAAGPAG